MADLLIAALGADVVDLEGYPEEPARDSRLDGTKWCAQGVTYIPCAP